VESNDLDEAYEYFKYALDNIVCAELTITMQHQPGRCDDGDISRILSKKELKERPFKMSFGDSSFFVYDEPLLFSTEKQEDSLENLAFYRCVALFNLALVCHLRSYNVDSWSVYKALHFYELSLACSKDCANHANCLEVAAAALNNKASIYFEFCEFATARMVLDTLLVMMIFTHGRPLEFEEKNTQGILFNLYMLRMPTSARTA
jgi:hypothetical protein